MPAWVTAAIVGAICGAVGAGLGFALEKLFGWKWARYLGIVGIAIGLAISRAL